VVGRFNAAQSFDEHVEKCLQIDHGPRDASVWSMPDALRLLLALSGGDDGNTFVLEDPTRVRDEVLTLSAEATMTRRLGERIHMGNVVIVMQAQETLFQSTALPLAAHTCVLGVHAVLTFTPTNAHLFSVTGQYDFTAFAPAGAREAALWYPERNDASNTGDSSSAAAETALDGFLQQFQSSHTGSGVPRLIDISPPTEQKTNTA
jgi:hypothetical protein